MLSQKSKSDLIKEVCNINLDLLDEQELDKLNNILQRIIKMSEIKKQEMTVQWIVNRKDKKLIKFVEGEDRTYKIAESAVNYIDEIVKRKTNVPVNVSIDGDNVVFIALKDAKVAEKPETKKEEVKVESKPEEKKVEPVVETSKEEPKQSSTKTVTVNYYSKDRLWWVFNETGEKTWLGIDESLVEFFKDINKGDILEISGESRKSKGRDVDFITSVKIVSKKPIEGSNQDYEPTKKSSYRDEGASDKRTAIMNAKDIIVAYINSKAEIVNTEEKVGAMLKRLTKVCYEALQSI